MPCGLVHNVGRGRVLDVMDLPHVARDHQHFVSLKFHERCRRNESVHRHCAPIDLRQDIVHLLNARDAIKRDAGIEQALEINFVGVLLQEKNVLAHDKSPDGVIDRRVIVVTLIHRELEQMFGATGDCRVVVADTALRFHSGASSLANKTYDSFAERARMIQRLWSTRRWRVHRCGPRRCLCSRRATESGTRAACAPRNYCRRLPAIRFVAQTTTTIAITHGARNAIATPIMRRLHMMAPTLCARVRRSVASKPLCCETILPWL